jgi:hypothetical protein
MEHDGFLKAQEAFRRRWLLACDRPRMAEAFASSAGCGIAVSDCAGA